MKTIYEKLLAIRSKVGTIPKSGFNSYAKYKYVTKDTLYDYFRAYFEEEKLLVLTSTEIVEHKVGQTAKGESTNRTMVQQKHVIINAENPDEKIEVFSVGTGEDKGDKDIYQADTGAMKYFLIDNFFVSGGDSFPGDVEYDKKGEPVAIDEKQLSELSDLADNVKYNEAKFLEYYKIEKLADLPVNRFQHAINALKSKETK